jgi:hypothetical protein
MKRLPYRPNLEHLKAQAKDLLTLYRKRDAGALGRIREALPAARGESDAECAGLGLRLRDMQPCIAREYGFPSWTDLKRFVEAAGEDDADAALLAWLRLVYAADIAGDRPPRSRIRRSGTRSSSAVNASASPKR